ncbi:hypothetical protein M422DRAFT_253401 [Sphaerobolus stellatus SS14]|uniref:Uncharacterized protein n=1 Tax=Sphaerobolus stellatus (strain SS14) TaxID=990650 RepID=A0A0C9VXN8_SPHS4|nr:hypothetical protein M422DRAFT_253401 [Sphaerobolus stellatus SS14]
MATNFSVGDRVAFVVARAQIQQTGVIMKVGDRLADGTLIVTIRTQSGQQFDLPCALFYIPTPLPD